jgi:putative acetyltransferase
MTIRPLEKSDEDAIVDIWYEASLVAHSFLSDEFLAAERSQIISMWLPNSVTTVFEEGGSVVGFLSLVGNEVGGIFVRPSHHGRGIGRALMDVARTRCKYLEVEVFEENSIGRRFYELYGFRQISTYLHGESGQRTLRLRLDRCSA